MNDGSEASTALAPDGSPSRITSGTHVKSFAALIVLTLVSFGASYLHLGVFEMPVALAIAAMKVSVVGLFFMSLFEETSSNRLAAVAGVLFVLMLLTFAVADIVMRGR
jgi:cytochrome c oxidase subunit 4